eukprot:200352-Pelagomonas_calceolata.AAC.1
MFSRQSNLARTSQGHIFFYKVKTHAGIARNECTDKIAKYQASFKDNDLPILVFLALAQAETLLKYCLAGSGIGKTSTTVVL